jgi:hypothetical protein
MSQYLDDPSRLPIKLDTTSNGEFEPIPLDALSRQASALARETTARHAKRLGVSRRQFLLSSCGAATGLLAINAAHAAAGRPGGYFELSAEAALEEEVASSSLAKREFIFDVQGHYVNPEGAWLGRTPKGGGMARALAGMPKAGCGLGSGDYAYLQCLGPDEFIKDIFLDSDTDLMVLSFVPSSREAEPLTIEEAAATRDIVEKMEGSHRLLLHARVNPNQPGDLEDMDRLAGFGISAWKTYTQWGPEANGFWMTDDVGIEFVERARSLGVRNICIHKGIPLRAESYEHSTCRDIGPIARRFPDVNFLIYHSGWVPGAAEGPYDPARTDGVDALVTSLQEAGVAPNSNVYAELGSTWRFVGLREPDSAAHLLGKLFRYVGEDNVLWGTDSIWYGSPQDQIQAFRTFQIAEELREEHGYPELTAALRRKVFGLNALRPYALPLDVLERHLGRDALAAMRRDYLEHPDPSFSTYGPKTRREFLHLQRMGG